MKHKFRGAKVSFDDAGCWLCLKIDNAAMARKFVHEQKDVTYTADITQYREKRSLDANAYFWVLCGELAGVLHMPREDIYRDLIRNIGNNNITLPIKLNAVMRFVAIWESRGLGFVCDRTGASKLQGYENVICYYGSSTYDTAQMSRLIDLMVQECEQQGIDTKTPEEIALLKEEWHA